MKALVVYSGGLDTTVCIPALREEGYDDITTVTVDVGQPEADIQSASKRAELLGTKHFVVDAKREFAEQYCVPALHFNADYFGYPLSTAIARPLIAKRAADIVHSHGPFDAIAHGCTGKGNDQFRIEYGLRQYAPGIPIRAIIRERNWTRTAEIEYAEKVGAPIEQSKTKIWSVDENLWGRSVEGGRLEEPDFAPPEEIFEWTKSPLQAPNEPLELTLEFECGAPKKVNGAALPMLELIFEMNKLAGEHGVGRIDIMEDRIIGLKVRENYECPGAVVLIAAHKALEALVCAPHERRFKSLVDAQWAELVYQGLWGDPLFDDLAAFCQSVQSRVSGVVHMKLYKGSCTITGRQSPYALYSEADASFDDSTLDQNAMTGMVQTHGMAGLLYSKLKSNL